jgi:hypothetical protein
MPRDLGFSVERPTGVVEITLALLIEPPIFSGAQSVD